MLEWVIIFLMAVVLVLLGFMLVGKTGIIRRRQLEKEIEMLKDKLQKYEGEAPKGAKVREVRSPPDLFDFVRDLETLRCAIAGSKICQRTLLKKYKLPPGPEILKRIITHSRLDPTTKEKLADEFLVGEVGRGILRSLNSGATIERAATEVGVPLIVTKGQISRLQVLGYLDNRLKPTELGWRSIK
jgi:hypothetical protein